jgi:hypothetical protein
MRVFALSQRLKHYSAASGFVYQYIFRGKLPHPSGEAHVFEVTAERYGTFAVQVQLAAEDLAVCAARLGSPLRWNDEYALAKLSLFDAFDHRDNPEALQKAVRPTASELLGYMKTLRMLEEDE